MKDILAAATINYNDQQGQPDPNNPQFRLLYSYNKRTGALTFTPLHRDNNGAVANVCQFCFLFDFDVEKTGFIECLNQKPDLPAIQDMCRLSWNWVANQPDQYTSETTLNNVWNRDRLYLHASFSNSQKHYLCSSTEFWEMPSKIYFDNIYGSEFTIYYTTDGIHRIDPLYAHNFLNYHLF